MNSSPSGSAASSSQRGQTIRWPAAYQPASAPVFARNEITIPAAPSDIWAWLLRADLWPTWYANSSDIRFFSHAGPELHDQAVFCWKTFGLQVTCKLLKFEAPYRLAWNAHRFRVAAWHPWLLIPLKGGFTHVLTDLVIV